MTRTKIIATLGPATRGQKAIERLLDAGVSGFRLNFSYDEHPAHQERIDSIRRVSEAKKRPVSIIADLQGLKLRVGELPAELSLTTGSTVRFAYRANPKDAGIIPTQHDFSDRVQAGQRMLLNDGKIETVIDRVNGSVIDVKVIAGGPLVSHNGINLPDTILKGAALTAKDLADVSFGVKAGVDYFALSFVQTAGDILDLRQRLRDLKSPAKIIAKVETKVATEHLEEIVKAADGVMVARGDLAVAMPTEAVPILQREITRLCIQHGKLVIVATQMLASMTGSPAPTRAEVSDVATAVITGADAVMLSEETTIGKFPVEAVKMMSRIATYAEANAQLETHAKPDDKSISLAIASAVTALADEIQAAAIIAETISGGSVRRLAAHRPQRPIVALSPDQSVAQQLAIVYGAMPIFEFAEKPFGEKITEYLKVRKLLKADDVIVTLLGKEGVVGGVDTVKVLTV